MAMTACHDEVVARIRREHGKSKKQGVATTSMSSPQRAKAVWSPHC